MYAFESWQRTKGPHIKFLSMRGGLQLEGDEVLKTSQIGSDSGGRPKFSILVPTAGARIALLRESVISVLGQSFADWEMLVSNNGGGAQVRRSLDDLLVDSRVSYVEWRESLAMPDHWESASQRLIGQYLLILTDRSILNRNALFEIDKTINSFGEHADVISWKWDLFYKKERRLVPSGGSGRAARLDSSYALSSAMSVSTKYPYALPRGLNSCVSMRLVDSLRITQGSAFSKLNPDFTFGFSLLMSSKFIVHLDKSLMISQGLSDSNGGKAEKSTASDYLRSLGISAPFELSPLKIPFVENTILEDFLRMTRKFERRELITEGILTSAYAKIIAELVVKFAAKTLPFSTLVEYAREISSSIGEQPIRFRFGVFREFLRRGSGSILIFGASLFPSRIQELVKKVHLTRRSSGVFSSALAAAGHFDE